MRGIPVSEIRSTLASGYCSVVEPGLDAALLAAIAGGRLSVVSDIADAVAHAPLTHLAYDTEVTAAGAPHDPRLDNAVHAFANLAPNGALLLVSSQLAVGTSDRWRAILDERERGLLLAHVPENLRLGRALEDFMHPDRMLVGANEDAAWTVASQALKPFFEKPLRMGLAAAEMSKHATNAYLALCVAFANDLAWLALAAGADPSEVAAGLRADPRVSPSAPISPGTAFSGATLRRDLVALRELGERCGRPELFAAVIEANRRHADIAFAWLQESLGSLQGAHIAVAGLTYKPGTSTLRDSLPLQLIHRLLEHEATVSAWDPLAEPVDAPDRFTRADSLESCVDGADALAVMTALPELAEVDWSRLRPSRRLVVDGCMGVDRSAAEAAGWIYRGLAAA